MAKKIEVGSVSPLIKDISSIYELMFDHGKALQEEHQVFLREFEIKRGSLDVDNLKAADAALAGPLQDADLCTVVSTATMDKILAASKDANRIARDALSQENQYIAQRTKIREGSAMLEAEQVSQTLAEQQKRIAQLDEIFEHQKKVLEEKYKL